MTSTDACVFPYPEGDSSIRRMAIEASELGFDSIVAIGADAGTYHGVEVIPGVIFRNPSQRDIKKNNGKNQGVFSFAEVGERGFSRSLLMAPGISAIRRLNRAKEHSFDHVAAKLAADRSVAVDLDLSCLIQQRGGQRYRTLRCYHEILQLHRKFEFPLTLSSGAKSILEQRTVREFEGLCNLFGMIPEEVRSALSAIPRVMEPASLVRVV